MARTSERTSVLRLRAKFTAHARTYAPTTALAYVAVAVHCGSAILSALLIEQVHAWSFKTWLCLLPIVVLFIGSRFRALGNMVHEAAHHTLVRGRRHNDLLGNFLAFFDFTVFDSYRSEHLTHHRHLGDPVRDLDFATRRQLFLRKGSFVKNHVLGPLTMLHVPKYISPILWGRGDSSRLRIARLAFNLSLVAVAHFVIGWRAFALYYVLPYATAYQVFRYWSDAFDHAGLQDEIDELRRTRNHILPTLWLNWLFFPRSDELHLVHHLFPALPTRNLEDVHRVMLSDAEYAALEHRWDGPFAA